MARKRKVGQSVVRRERIISYLRQYYNPLISLTPAVLKQQHANFDAGYLREFAMSMEYIKRTDDVLVGVTAKREKGPAVRGYEIIMTEETDQAMRHKEALEYFYNHCRCVNAVDENERGGVRLLLRMMMYAVGFKYSPFEILWDPDPDGLTAEFRYVPLWFFENTSGRLRFLESDGALSGADLEEGSWLLASCTDFLMKACSIAYLYKHTPLRDWLIYSGRNGMPGVAGKTSAQYGSAEWTAMEDAVEAFAAEFAAVFSKDDEITAIDVSAKGELPYPKLIERMDRIMSTIWRGADLSTISAGSGEGSGASLQGEEKEILEADDAAMLSEALNEYVDPWVIRYSIGDDIPMAYIQVRTSQRRNVTQELAIDQGLRGMGFPLTLRGLSERYNRALPDDDDEILPPPAAPVNPFMAAPNVRSSADFDKVNRPLIAEAVAATLDVRTEHVAPFFEAMEQKVSDESLTDAELLDALEQMVQQLPELFLDKTAAEVAKIVEALLGTGMVQAIEREEGAAA